MARVLLAGESWVSATIDHKGIDPFAHTQVQIGCARLLEALQKYGHTVTHLRSHDVAEFFPSTLAELDKYDVVLLSDIGANSLLLPPAVFHEGKPRPHRLKLLSQWVSEGGGLMMAGGYLSFQGFQGKANYHRSALEDILPVNIFPFDDRVETPQGVNAEVTSTEHAITAGLPQSWPILLGYQELIAKPDALVLAEIEGNPLLTLRTVAKGKTIAYASDISPHWAPQEFMDWPGYELLFGRCIDWLSERISG